LEKETLGEGGGKGLENILFSGDARIKVKYITAKIT